MEVCEATEGTGIEPASLLLLRYSKANPVRLPNALGIVPVKRFLSKNSSTKPVRVPRVLEMVPVRRLVSARSLDSFGNLVVAY